MKSVQPALHQLTQYLDEIALQGRHTVETLAPSVWILRPKEATYASENDRDVSLSLIALIHGNEVCGVFVLVELLRLVIDGTVVLPFAIGIALGNEAAAAKGRRFVEKDLNRSFGTEQLATHEDRRAKDIEKLLKRSHFLLDFHQTIRRSDFPFFIFGYAERTAVFANLTAPDMPIVTYWGTPFSNAGKTTVEYMREAGATALTLEMGRLGYDSYQCAAGVLTAIRALHSSRRLLEGTAAVDLDRDAITNDLFTFAEVLLVKEHAAVLDPGWYNFRQVTAGERLGHAGGGEFAASVSGWMLFPKYDDPSTSRATLTAAPREICRILRRASAAELPRHTDQHHR